MDDLSIIDSFLADFTKFIDSGFGLLGPDVYFLTTILIGIDITLAGLFWAFSDNNNVIASLIKKVLYVGFFALILNKFNFLADIIFRSFSQLGITASGSGITPVDIMRPGFVANAGFEAGRPILAEVATLVGPFAFFDNFIMIAILMFSFVLILLAFFILAIQLFVTIIEFKLTTLAGFVLIPFALFNKTAFLAERVLGNVVSSGIKLMVLTIIVGFGSTLFTQFSSAFTGGSITLEQAMATVLGALTILGLGIFGPGIATGLVSGAPQLGAGAAVGTAALAGGAVVAGAAGAKVAGGAAASAVKAGASVAGAGTTAFQLGIAGGGSGAARLGAGISSVAEAGGGALKSAAMKPVNAVKDSFNKGTDAVFEGRRGASKGMGGVPGGSPASSANSGNDNWSARFERRQNMREAGQATMHSVRGGDSGGAGAVPSITTDREE